MVGGHAGDAVTVHEEAGDAHTLGDGGSAHLGALGHGGGHADGICASLVGDIRTAHEVIDSGEGEELGDLLGGDDLVGDAEPDLEVPFAHKGLHARRRRGDRQVTDRTKAGRVTGLFFQSLVQISRVAAHPQRCLVVEASTRDETRSVPGRAGGEVVLLQEENIAHPQLGQVVGDRAANDSTTHDDETGPCGQGAHHVSLLERAGE